MGQETLQELAKGHSSVESLYIYIQFFFTQIQKFKQGDEVVVKSDENLVKELQNEHGGWNESMISVSFIFFFNFLLRKLLCACAEAKNVN